MENRRRFLKNQMQISKSKAKSNCKKHPKHKQNPGVCSVCLSEKLSLLSKTSPSNTTTITSSCSSSSLSSLSSSSDVSSCSSPPRYRMDTNVLMKSRSLALIMRRREGGILEESNGNKKKGGFLSKLLSPRRNRKDEGLAHSRTMRERVITRLRTTAA
ncbi:PREDICTED: uncharacterized protein LOC109207166 [Nicotiana attenuata]|uniref:Uncharacterized protein n=1 Tax=Nicotiana attenuata TaxID=49451 RepID=A0A314KTB5_NICAT|nr:PREDICTED: uncharacterized protein LOC109207166 [Nicotiana attenuata]OIT32562.1 hypothetical protein A4A49_23355 [Nicotiana attenuata]